MFLPHLTQEQRDLIRHLFDTAKPQEILRCVAGCIAHDSKDYENGQIVSTMILNAANTITHAQ